MQIHITARRIELTAALADYATKKIEKVARNFTTVVRAQVVLSVEKHRHIAEVVTHAAGREDFRAMDVAGDLYAAVDKVSEKLRKHLSRKKDRRVRSRRDLPPKGWDAALTENGARPDPVISRISRTTPKALSVTEAVQALDESDFGFLLFRAEDDAMKIIYRRKDRTYGLLEPYL